MLQTLAKSNTVVKRYDTYEYDSEELVLNNWRGKTMTIHVEFFTKLTEQNRTAPLNNQSSLLSHVHFTTKEGMAQEGRAGRPRSKESGNIKGIFRLLV